MLTPSIKRVSKSPVQSQDKKLDEIRRQIVGIDTKVPLLGGGEAQYVYLDNAASTPVLKQVLSKINEFMPWYASVHRGSGFKSQVATEAYEDSRQIVGNFFGANSKEHVVIFGKNTTEAINKLSYRLNLKKSDVVLVSLLEHHSNDLPWRKQATVKRIKTNRHGELDETSYDQLLKQHKGRIKLVALTGGSNITGHMPNIYSLAKKAHAAGAQILVDCAQLAPHRSVKVGTLSDPEHLDYIAVSAHKMYAPFGTGALIGRRDTFETGVPELCGGGTIDVVTTRRVEWTAPPDRDEAGTPNVVGAVAMASAITQLQKIGMQNVAKHEAELTSYALRKLSQVKGINIFGDTDQNATTKRLGVIPFTITGKAHGMVAAALSAEYGIGVRSGCFCAHPYVTSLLQMSTAEIDKFGEDVAIKGDRSQMPGMVRASFGMYNNKHEIDSLAGALHNIAAGQLKGSYQQNKRTGDFYAAGWEPSYEKYFSLT